MQQHIENSIGGSSQECDWAVFDHASWKDDVSALSDARNVERAEKVLVCAFDKAVRRKALAFAAGRG
jgi:hypothetical protein